LKPEERQGEGGVGGTAAKNSPDKEGARNQCSFGQRWDIRMNIGAAEGKGGKSELAIKTAQGGRFLKVPSKKKNKSNKDDWHQNIAKAEKDEAATLVAGRRCVSEKLQELKKNQKSARDARDGGRTKLNRQKCGIHSRKSVYPWEKTFPEKAQGLLKCLAAKKQRPGSPGQGCGKYRGQIFRTAQSRLNKDIPGRWLEQKEKKGKRKNWKEKPEQKRQNPGSPQ